jgi:hypothetical protein
MVVRKLVAAALGAVALFSAGAADAALVLVGSWQLNGGSANGAALSAQHAAAQLFGRQPTDYSVSTDPVGVDLQAWYLVLGTKGSVAIADQSATSFAGSDLSAYTFDAVLTAEQDRFVNYAFRAGVPEAATWMMMIVGFGAAGAMLRCRRTGVAWSRSGRAFDRSPWLEPSLTDLAAS